MLLLDNQIFVLDIEHATTFEHINAGSTELAIQFIKESDVVFDVRKLLQNLIIGHEATILALGHEPESTDFEIFGLFSPTELRSWLCCDFDRFTRNNLLRGLFRRF